MLSTHTEDRIVEGYDQLVFWRPHFGAVEGILDDCLHQPPCALSLWAAEEDQVRLDKWDHMTFTQPLVKTVEHYPALNENWEQVVVQPDRSKPAVTGAIVKYVYQ